MVQEPVAAAAAAAAFRKPKRSVNTRLGSGERGSGAKPDAGLNDDAVGVGVGGGSE